MSGFSRSYHKSFRMFVKMLWPVRKSNKCRFVLPLEINRKALFVRKVFDTTLRKNNLTTIIRVKKKRRKKTNNEIRMVAERVRKRIIPRSKGWPNALFGARAIFSSFFFLQPRKAQGTMRFFTYTWREYENPEYSVRVCVRRTNGR